MISFVITTFNRPSLLQKCVESIYNLKLNCNFEIVVSDDCSAPDSIEFIRVIKGIKLLESETNKGLAANINRGLKAAKGDYIVYLQDDWLLRNIFKDYILEMCDLLDNDRLEMIRLTYNIKFNSMNRLSKHISSIRRFAFRNIPN